MKFSYLVLSALLLTGYESYAQNIFSVTGNTSIEVSPLKLRIPPFDANVALSTSLNGGSIYIFKKAYPLTAVKNYTCANQHLLEVLWVQEIGKSGPNVSEMNLGLSRTN